MKNSVEEFYDKKNEEFDDVIKEMYNKLTDEEKSNLLNLCSKTLPSFKVLEQSDKFGNSMQKFLTRIEIERNEDIVNKACNMIQQMDMILNDFINEYLRG